MGSNTAYAQATVKRSTRLVGVSLYEALRLDVGNHVISFNQSECINFVRLSIEHVKQIYLIFAKCFRERAEDEQDVDIEVDDDDKDKGKDDSDDWLIWSTSEKRRKRRSNDDDDDDVANDAAKCPDVGVFDLGACKFGAPLYLSW